MIEFIHVVVTLSMLTFIVITCVGCYKAINQDVYVVYKEQDSADPSKEEKDYLVVKKRKLFKLT